MKERAILNFHHIFKTGGTTVTALLKQFFTHGESVNGGELAKTFKRQVGDDFNMLSIKEKNDSIKKFIGNLFPKPYRFIYGHGNIINVKEFAAPTFTFLRQPKNQIYSSFLQMSANQDHNLSPERYTEDIIKIYRCLRTSSFQDFIFFDHPLVISKVWNPQLFSFFYNPFLVNHFDQEEFKSHVSFFQNNGDEILRTAKNKLEDMFFVGVTECLDVDLALLLKILGLPEQVYVQRHNVRSIVTDPTNRMDATRSIPDDFYSLDLELYEHALKIREEMKLSNKSYFVLPDLEFAPRILQTNNQADIYKVSEPLIGTGWQERYNDQKNVLVWTGPGLDTTLKLRVSTAQNYVVTVGVVGAQDSKQIELAKIFIDDIEYRVLVMSSDTYPNFLLKIEADLEKEFELKIRVPFCVNPAKSLGVTDDRNLGIAVNQILISPNKSSLSSQHGNFVQKKKVS